MNQINIQFQMVIQKNLIKGLLQKTSLNQLVRIKKKAVGENSMVNL